MKDDTLEHNVSSLVKIDGSRQPYNSWVEIDFGVNGNASDYTGEGWAGPNLDYTWSLGYQSTISFPVPRVPADVRLTFRARPLCFPGKRQRQRIVLFVNQQLAGMFIFDGPDERTAVVDLPWRLVSGLLVTTLMFQFPDAISPKKLGVGEDIQVLGVAFSSLTIADAVGPAPGDATHPETELPPELQAFNDQRAKHSELFRRFESLGHDCEFGMVHKAFNIHTVGLLKFSGISADSVADLLEGGLNEVGKRENLYIDQAADGEMVIRDRKFGFLMHSFNYAGYGLDEEALLAREAKRLPRLARKLEEDVESGDKILVFNDPADSRKAVMRMHAALRAKGQASLLWVRKSSPKKPPGLVVADRPGLILAFVAQRPPRVPGPGLADPDLNVWTKVCTHVLAIHEGQA